MTSEALLAGADEDAKARLLPRIAAGEVAAFVDGDAPVLDGDLATIVVRRHRRRLFEVTAPRRLDPVDGPDDPARDGQGGTAPASATAPPPATVPARSAPSAAPPSRPGSPPARSR